MWRIDAAKKSYLNYHVSYIQFVFTFPCNKQVSFKQIVLDFQTSNKYLNLTYFWLIKNVMKNSIVGWFYKSLGQLM